MSDSLESAFSDQGEACTASSRLLVHISIYDEFVARLGALVKKLLVGNGMNKAAHLGNYVSKPQQQRGLKYIRIGKDEGAVIAAQGALPSDPACKNGFFMPPTLFKDVTRDIKVAREEIFVPVATVTKFDSEEEPSKTENDTPHGLTCGNHTRDAERNMRVARYIDVGMAWVNHYLRSTVRLPFRGVKDK